MRSTRTVLALASIVVLTLLARRILGGDEPSTPDDNPDPEV